MAYFKLPDHVRNLLVAHPDDRWITRPIVHPSAWENRPTTGQSRRHSALETCVNVAIGYLVSLVAQLLIFPLFGIHIPLLSNIAIGAFFTVVSIVRSYCLRRYFNSWVR